MRFSLLLGLGLTVLVGAVQDGGTHAYQQSPFLGNTTICSPKNDFQPYLVVEICSSIIDAFFKSEQLVKQQAQLQGLTTSGDRNGTYVVIPRGKGFIVPEPECTFNVTNVRGTSYFNSHVHVMSFELRQILKDCPRYSCNQVIGLQCPYTASYGVELLNTISGMVYSTQPPQ